MITHAHADHAYRGNQSYLVASEGEELARIRLDRDANISSQAYGQTVTMSGVKVSFHPAGHILGSAQVRVEYKGEVWVQSGDYKLTPDATCAAFEHIKCIAGTGFRRNQSMVAAKSRAGKSVGDFCILARQSSADFERH